jgi:hypothetical protein
MTEETINIREMSMYQIIMEIAKMNGYSVKETTGRRFAIINKDGQYASRTFLSEHDAWASFIHSITHSSNPAPEFDADNIIEQARREGFAFVVCAFPDSYTLPGYEAKIFAHNDKTAIEVAYGHSQERDIAVFRAWLHLVRSGVKNVA